MCFYKITFQIFFWPEPQMLLIASIFQRISQISQQVKFHTAWS